MDGWVWVMVLQGISSHFFSVFDKHIKGLFSNVDRVCGVPLGRVNQLQPGVFATKAPVD